MTEPSDEIQRLNRVFTDNYPATPQNPDYDWHPINPVSVFYRQTQERAINKIIRRHLLPLDHLHVLDAGCGPGNFLGYLLRLGAPAGNLHGIDLVEARIVRARMLLPENVEVTVADAAHLPFPASSFDLVSQFTMFSSILNANLRSRVASELMRVTKNDGYILWYDMRSSHSATTKGLDLQEIHALFPNCTTLDRIPLHSPYSARLARRSFLLCEFLEHFPFVNRTHYLILLQKMNG